MAADQESFIVWGDKAASVYSMDGGEHLIELLGHEDWINSAALSSDGRRALTASDDGTARVWSVASGSPIATLQQDASVWNALFTSKPDLVAVHTGGQDVKLWRLPDLEELVGSESWAIDAEFSHDGRRIAAADAKGAAIVWNRKTKERQRLGDGQDYVGPVWDIAFSPDDRYLAVSSSGLGRTATVRVRDLQDDTLIDLDDLLDFVRPEVISYDERGRLFITDLPDVYRWDGDPTEKPKRLKKFDFETYNGHGLIGVAISPDGETLVVAYEDGEVAAYDTDHQKKDLERALDTGVLG